MDIGYSTTCSPIVR